MILKNKESSLARPINYLLMKAKGKDLCSYQATSEKMPTPPTSSGREEGEKELTHEEIEAIAKEEARGTWGSQWDFAMSCIAYAVGLGNVWRFPYLCYKNGGGAFLIPYTIAMLTCGIPLFLLEVSVGQYLGVGDGSWAGEDCFDPESGLPYNESNAFLVHGLLEKDTMPPVESYWNNHVLQISSGIDELGGIRWELMAYLALAWCLVYLVIWKGLHNSGKIIWASAIFPYIILTILFIKAMTLDGAVEGIKYLFTPDWERLKTSECWIDGGTQIFFSYGVGIGALLALGSYNKFHHNCYRDAMFVCCVNTATSLYSGIVIFAILGFMAKQKGVEDIGDVVKSGPGLAFLVYPEVVRQLEPSALWAILFFLMLFTLGVDSQFCGIESLIVGLVDNWPNYLRPRKILFTAAMCVFMFCLGLPMITNGGVFIFQLMDFYAASGMSPTLQRKCIIALSLWLDFASTTTGILAGSSSHHVLCLGFSSFTFSSILPSPMEDPIHIHYGAKFWALASVERLLKGITPNIKPRPDAIIALEKQRQKRLADEENPEVEMKLVEPESNHL
ncbi:SLC6A1 [Lepeophtheirus salmonis]|uniref:Transporter n=1 Tax=Lepeophtheirus salmonis TaxID=72036 RepID=A0A7R8CTB0_LEPSM|nr:SLC6A1 [Lepeophtheirus salmonis]CAF2922592.1 SLC6A1 [Lepeophtheirus salmonis]